PYTTNQQRLDALPVFLHRYNHTRPHTAIGNRPPASRL
ncbi:MAG TPA: integrase core domain-containing protein, partial [Dehalococcoidia bacterium]|nr:integrase core domain-containing protein [Dehalococcoidia bacterium]